MDDIRLIIFDLAGTTMMDNGRVSAAFIAALNAHEIAIFVSIFIISGSVVPAAASCRHVMELLEENSVRYEQTHRSLLQQ